MNAFLKGIELPSGVMRRLAGQSEQAGLTIGQNAKGAGRVLLSDREA
jgi:hypothetical protein